MTPRMATDPEEDQPGLLASLGRLIGSTVGLIQTRLELLANDLAFAHSELTRLAIAAGVVVVCLQAGILLGVIFLILAVPESARATVVGIAALVLLAAALGGALWVRRWLRTRSRFFAGTLEELRKDRDKLRGRT